MSPQTFVRLPNPTFGNLTRLCLIQWLLPCPVDHLRKLDRVAPSLQPHYRTFLTPTRDSAPVPRIGTLALVGCPLERLPCHRGDRFPRSTHEPEARSRRLHAGRHLGRKQVSPRRIPGERLPPGFDVVPPLSTPHRRFACARLLDSHLTASRSAFSSTLTTPALDRRSLRWFAACSYKPAARGLPSSHMQHGCSGHLCHKHSFAPSWRTIVDVPTESVSPTLQLLIKVIQQDV
jgi:hypothetical protein